MGRASAAVPGRIQTKYLIQIMRVCRVVTIPFFVWHHLRTQIHATIAAGHEVHVICSDGPEFERLRQITGLRLFQIDIRRRVSPVRDVFSLIRLYLHFRKYRYDIVHSVTPKAGLLAMLAAWLAGTKSRFHHFSGQAWLSQRGFVRWAARVSDRVIVRLATRCYSDSYSQRQFLEEEGLAPAGVIQVLGDGSIAGVDLDRFNPARLRPLRPRTRKSLGIPDEAAVVIFVGRVTNDKGIRELVAAFDIVSKTINACLIVVGCDEPHIEPLSTDLLVALRSNPRIRWIGYSEEPELYLAAADIFCLPSYREGFSVVLLEAAALGVAAVATRIVGIIDLIKDGDTGILVEPKNADDLAAALTRLIRDESLREKLARGARERAESSFRSDRVNALLLADYTHFGHAQP
jgi:glycosyltransferase involved in cell wall biosynthesis